jgi:hypothetical protein
VVAETAAGTHLVKLRGAAQGTASLVAEVIVGALADHLGLPVPARRIVTLTQDTLTDDRNDELADLLTASIGDNLGFVYLPTARAFHPGEVARVDPEFASRVRWLDWLVMNPDRSRANPNLLVEGARFWLIDHGAALPFHHNWATATEEAPHREEAGHPHLLAAQATRIRERDALLTAAISREVLVAAVADVPDSFLAPLMSPNAAAGSLERRRAAYVAFLWKRLQGPRHLAGP